MTTAQRSILVVAMLAQGLAVGLTIGILPILLEPLEAAFQAPRTQIASGQILIMLALTVSSILTGIALDRGMVRRVMLAGAAGMITALLLASTATSLPVLAVAAVLAGASLPSIGPLAAGKLVTHYFDEGRGRAMGLMSIGPPLGSGAFAALAGWLLLSMEWRDVLSLFAGVAAVGLLPVIWLIVPRRFQDVPAAGATPAAGDASVGGGAQVEAGPPPTMLDVLRRPAFLWAGGMFALLAGISSAWIVHAAAYLGGHGLDEAGRSNVLALQFWMGVPGSLVFGALAERVDVTRLLAVVILAAVACYVGFALATSVVIVTILSALVGLSTGGLVPLYLMLLGKRMGPATLGRAMGLSNLLMLPVMSLSVLMAAAIFEAQASYTVVLWIFAAGFGGGLVCLLGGRSGSERS